MRELFKLNPECTLKTVCVRCLKTFCCVLIQRQLKSLDYISLMAFLFTSLSLCPESQHVHLNASHVLPEPPRPAVNLTDTGVNQQLLY